MKIRTQLILAFILLSVVPLSGIVLYSYASSQKAVRAAQMREAEEMAQQMDRRVADIRSEVSERVARLGDLPLGRLVTDEAGGARGNDVAGSIVAQMGDAAPFVEAIEFLPAIPEPPADAGPEPARGASGSGGTHVAAVAPVAPVPPAPATGATPVPAPTIAARHGSPDQPVIVINVDELIRDVRSISALDDAQRKEVEKQLEKANAALLQVNAMQMKSTEEWTKTYEKQIEAWEAKFEAAEGEVPPPPLPPVTVGTAAELRAKERILSRVARHAAGVRAHAASPPSPPSAPGAEGAAEATGNASEATVAAPEPAVSSRPAVTVQPRAKTEEARNQTKILFGKDLQMPVKREGSVVGEIRPRIRAGMLIQSILGVTERGSDEIPFAIDNEGKLWTSNEPARDAVQTLGVEKLAGEKQSRTILDKWVVATSRDEESGLTLGIARPIREPLAEVRRAATRNFAYGLGLIGFALIGIIPLANHMTRDIGLVTHGAERISQGDLDTEVPVRSTNELGALAAAFNRMARDLRDHQARLVEEERRRKDEEIQRRLLSAEFARKTGELEDARAFQLALLPKELPKVPGLSVAVHMRTATEVGGDYYDFHVSPEGTLTVAVGDATGHGARAGTMVTVIKSLFSMYHADRVPGAFLAEAGETVRRMDLGRMAMALQLAQISASKVTLASAAMPPALLYRAASRKVIELVGVGMPLGAFGGGYEDVVADIEPGDTLLLMSDGFPELLDRRGEPMGYVAVENAFRMVATQSPEEIIAALSRAADERTGGEPPNDDITFVVVKKS
jgi:serine phosphatase RsbU (regulator of sigma subunit)